MNQPYNPTYTPPFPQLTVELDNGEDRLGPFQLYLIGFRADGIALTGLYVVGDDIGGTIILGRDVLNKLPLFLDGPEKQATILDDAIVQQLRRKNKS